jgi:hypothetical protein
VKLNYNVDWQGYSWEKTWLVKFMGTWMMLPDPIAVTILVTQAFDKLKIPLSVTKQVRHVT